MRPALLARFCAAALDALTLWEARETRTHPRTLPVARADAPVATSTALHHAWTHALRHQLSDARHALHMRAHAPGTLEVPRAGAERTLGAAQRTSARLHGAAVVDAARFLGELFCVRAVVDHACVAEWLDTLLLTPRSWVHVPLHELEAACALLLLVAPGWSTAASARPGPDLPDTRARPTVLQRCLHRLDDLVHSALVPEVTKEWVRVRNIAKFDHLGRRRDRTPRMGPTVRTHARNEPIIPRRGQGQGRLAVLPRTALAKRLERMTPQRHRHTPASPPQPVLLVSTTVSICRSHKPWL